jgi:hypothetical protein
MTAGPNSVWSLAREPLTEQPEGFPMPLQNTNCPPPSPCPPLGIIELIRIDCRLFWLLRHGHRCTPRPEHRESVFRQFDARLAAIGRDSWLTRPEKRRVREKLRWAVLRDKSHVPAHRRDS